MRVASQPHVRQTNSGWSNRHVIDGPEIVKQIRARGFNTLEEAQSHGLVLDRLSRRIVAKLLQRP
jgi:hypothetical protein